MGRKRFTLPDEPGRSEGIVIHSLPLGDADLLLHIMTREFGKISLLAKHARRTKKRFVGSIDLFDHAIFEWKFGKGTLPHVSLFKPLHGFKGVREDLDKLAASALLCEATDLLFHEGEAGEGDTFDILLLGLQAVDESGEMRAVLRSLFLALDALLQESGYGTALTQPSSKALLRLILRIEEVGERRLKTRGQLLELLESWKKSA